MISARAGHDKAMDNARDGFLVHKIITKEEYESTLRAWKESKDEMTSEQRAKAIEIMDQISP